MSFIIIITIILIIAGTLEHICLHNEATPFCLLSEVHLYRLTVVRIVATVRLIGNRGVSFEEVNNVHVQYKNASTIVLV